jgi:hypothetical protein
MRTGVMDALPTKAETETKLLQNDQQAWCGVVILSRCAMARSFFGDGAELRDPEFIPAGFHIRGGPG